MCKGCCGNCANCPNRAKKVEIADDFKFRLGVMYEDRTEVFHAKLDESGQYYETFEVLENEEKKCPGVYPKNRAIEAIEKGYWEVIE